MTEEELEKQNKELHQKIIYLQNDKEDIIANWYCDKVGKCKIAELEAQIEKMKTRIKEIILSNDFVNTPPYQNLKNTVSALCDFYKEIKEK